jgi:DNA-directed RNA polymerase subunit F
MIRESTPLSMAEVSELVGKENEKSKDLNNFIKTFVRISTKDAKELKKELEELNLIQLKDTNIVKIIDFLPEDEEDLSKVLLGVSLSQEEVKTILDIVKKY